jgi:hypothetical protein
MNGHHCGWELFCASALTTFCGIVGNSSLAAQDAHQRSVNQYGISWIFDRPIRVGQFVNGDYYIVGPVTVTAIEPQPLVDSEVPLSELGVGEQRQVRDRRFVRNGSMLNPPARAVAAYDSGIRNYFHRELLACLPIELRPGDCLVSAVSLKVGEKPGYSYHADGKYRDHLDDSPLKTAAVLTCLAEALPRDAFRPSYGDRLQRIYYARNLNRKLLEAWPRPANSPPIGTWIRIYQRPWINCCFFGFEQPMENMPHYGQWVGQAQSTAGLMLMLDYPPALKEQLLISMVQVGIDYWGLIRNGHPGWQGWGGHGSGRKFPIVIAGMLLGDAEMAAPTRTIPKVEFGEDNQTMYGKGWTGATALFAGHSGIQSATGKAERPVWGPYEHLHPSQWTQGNCSSEAYRRANTSSSWVGQALVLRLLHAETNWNHDAFFDYVDRWMTEDDREHRREILKYWPKERFGDKDTWTHQGDTREPFVKTMWQKYRKTVGPLPESSAAKASKN